MKPSEAKLNDSVRCAELDEDLYFLMTLQSGRSLLKRVLLETYTQLSEDEIVFPGLIDLHSHHTYNMIPICLILLYTWLCHPLALSKHS